MKGVTLIPSAWAATFLFALLGISCGASRDASALDASPEAPIVNVGERIQIQGIGSDEVAGELEWEVAETYGGGLLLSKGVLVTYVAPPSAGTYHLLLRAPKVGGGTLKRTIPIQVRPILRMEPAEAMVSPGGSRTFAVRQKGLPRGTFTWSVEDPEGGSIGPDGIYHAPATKGTYRVLATSTEDKEAVIAATVTVQ
jgi:hypothetical protein